MLASCKAAASQVTTFLRPIAVTRDPGPRHGRSVFYTDGKLTRLMVDRELIKHPNLDEHFCTQLQEPERKPSRVWSQQKPVFL